ncbi:MAG: hypothetical protein LBJ94_00745 [Puniceicoccales bacterium]|jgi:hypothetical protein|nr:hypothetical protein [Puniceicoccales bacterium]
MHRIKFSQQSPIAYSPAGMDAMKNLGRPSGIFNRNVFNRVVEEGKNAIKARPQQGAKMLERLIADRKAQPAKSPKIPIPGDNVLHTLQKIGFKVQDCGGGGNNCLLLSALSQLHPDLPWEEVKSDAQQLRKDIFSLVQGDVKGYLRELGDSFEAMGISNGDKALLDNIAAIVDSGAHLNENIVKQLGEQVEKERAREGYAESRSLVAHIAALQFVYNSTRTGESIAADAAKYVAKVCQRDVFMLAVSEKGVPYYEYYPRDNGSSRDNSWVRKVPYQEVLRNRGAYLKDDAVLIYGRPGHYQAIVPAIFPKKDAPREAK